MEKSLGNLSPDQLAKVLGSLREFKEQGDLGDLYHEQRRFRRLLGHPNVMFYWAWAYEIPLHELIGLLAYLIDEAESIKALGEAEDKMEALLKMNEEDNSDPPVARAKASRLLMVLALLQALQRSIACISSYSVSMSTMVDRVRRGDREALKNIVRIDPTAVAAPSVAKALSIATIKGDHKFLREFANAIDSPRVALRLHDELRYIEAVLSEARAFEAAPRAHIFDVVANQLKLYEQERGDPFKGLFRFFERQRATRVNDTV